LWVGQVVFVGRIPTGFIVLLFIVNSNGNPFARAGRGTIERVTPSLTLSASLSAG